MKTLRRSTRVWACALLSATLALGAASCFDDGRSQSKDEARLRAMRAEIDALIGVPACTDSSQCAYAPIGDKPCGGPWEFLVYSRANVDEAALLQKIARHDAFEADMNRRYGRISDCSTPVPPQLECRDGTCQRRVATN